MISRRDVEQGLCGPKWLLPPECLACGWLRLLRGGGVYGCGAADCQMRIAVDAVADARERPRTAELDARLSRMDIWTDKPDAEKEKK